MPVFFLLCNKIYQNIYYIYSMRKLIDITEYAKFLKDYKESHGVNATTFIDLAIKEKIIKVIAQNTLNEYRESGIYIKQSDNATNR